MAAVRMDPEELQDYCRSLERQLVNLLRGVACSVGVVQRDLEIRVDLMRAELEALCPDPPEQLRGDAA